MSVKYLAVAALLLTGVHVGCAYADGTFIPASDRTDMVYDDQRDLIYIADGSSILRYDITQAAFLKPVDLGGKLKALDISPDGNTLAVADATNDGTNEWVHLVDLNTLIDAKATVAVPSLLPASESGGTYAVAYAADGSLIVTSGFATLSFAQLQRLVPSTGHWSTIETGNEFGLGANSMVAASGDGQSVAFAEGSVEPALVGIYKLSSGQLEIGGGQPWDNYEVGMSAAGSQLAVPTYSGTFVYDKNLELLTKIGSPNSGDGGPVGVAYHPVENMVFFPWEGSSEVRVYDTTTFTQLGSYDFQDSFQNPGNQAFQQGRTRLSRDGSLLMVTVTGGVRFLRMYSPLAAAPVKLVSTSTPGGVVIRLTQGSIGNNGHLSYTLGSRPQHGIASISGHTLVYSPRSNFSGTDNFTYEVHYGRAFAYGNVSVTLVPRPRYSLHVAASRPALSSAKSP